MATYAGVLSISSNDEASPFTLSLAGEDAVPLYSVLGNIEDAGEYNSPIAISIENVGNVPFPLFMFSTEGGWEFDSSNADTTETTVAVGATYNDVLRYVGVASSSSTSFGIIRTDWPELFLYNDVEDDQVDGTGLYSEE